MKATRSILAALCAIALMACGNSNDSQSSIAPKPKGAVRLMTYNVGAVCKFIDDEFTKEDNVKLLAGIIKEFQPDAIAIQELDSCNTRNDYFQLKAITESCNPKWSYFYGPAINYKGGKYGTGVASQNKRVIKTLYIPIPVKENSEARVLTIAEYKDYVIACTHLNGGQPAQVEYLNAEIKRLYGNSKKPVFLGGDMNAYPDSPMMDEFRKAWTILSMTTKGTSVKSPQKPCIDYVLQLNNNATPAKVIGSDVVTKAYAGDVQKASDHYAVYVDIEF